MFNFINLLFQTPHRRYPNEKNLQVNTKNIVSYLSRGNILLQNSRYTTQQDIDNMKKSIFQYFSK